ncbi:MAG: plasmid partition protein ParG [Candidatus Nanoarchaeia archaeon]|nr:plasmid partition protein ParG [Candidatus Nanoarchaeia archaeon]
MGRVNVEIENELHKKLKVACALSGKTIQQTINEALEEKLRREKSGKK